jgi:hypothetical protein
MHCFADSFCPQRISILGVCGICGVENLFGVPGLTLLRTSEGEARPRQIVRKRATENSASFAAVAPFRILLLIGGETDGEVVQERN